MNYKNHTISILAITFISFGLFTAPCADAKDMADNRPPRSIHISGTGKAFVPPDKAELTLSVEAQAKTAEAARNQAATAMTALIKTVKDAGVAEKDIQTRSVSLYPNYSPDTASKIVGYQLSNQVAVVVRKLDKLGEIMDAAVNAGGNLTRIQGVSFGITNPDQALATAREAAYRDAKTKAEQYAKLAGVSLGAPLHISEGSNMPPIPIAYGEMRAMKASVDSAPTPVQTGEQEVSITVDIMFAID